MPMDAQYSFDAAVDEMVLRFGRRNDNSFQARCREWLNSAMYRAAASLIDAPDLEDTLTLTIDNTVNEYDLRTTTPPITDIIGIKYVKNLWTGYRMRRFSFEEYRQLVNQANGDPMRWSRKGYVLALDPVPNNDTTTMTIEYRRLPEAGVLEFDSKHHDSLIKIAVSIGWSALMEHQRGQSVMAELPPTWQAALAQPLSQEQWEAMWDPDLGLRSMASGY